MFTYMLCRTNRHPTERYGHSSVMLNTRNQDGEAESRLFVFGGFSQFCEDFCDDVWAFDFCTMGQITPGHKDYNKESAPGLSLSR